MAGMLPGVECARRRRIHQSGGLSDSSIFAAIGLTRKSSFCLLTTNHETQSFCQKQRSMLYDDCEEEELGGIAREAKRRLDERLRSQKFQPKRQKNKENSVKGELHAQSLVLESKKRMSWPKLSWKSSRKVFNSKSKGYSNRL